MDLNLHDVPDHLSQDLTTKYLDLVDAGKIVRTSWSYVQQKYRLPLFDGMFDKPT